MAEEKPQSGTLAFLKKIGLPGIIAGMVSALVTMVPILFQIDERYAKADDIEPKMVVISKQLTDLTTEVGRLAGTQQVMVAIMSAKPEVRFSTVPRRLSNEASVEVPAILPT